MQLINSNFGFYSIIQTNLIHQITIRLQHTQYHQISGVIPIQSSESICAPFLFNLFYCFRVQRKI